MGRVGARSGAANALAFKLGWFTIDDIGRLAKMDGDVPSLAVIS
jgi:hypothetical protein